jgi:hypothetical protein
MMEWLNKFVMNQVPRAAWMGCRICLLTALLAYSPGGSDAGLREDFETSEFEFLRTDSNLPNMPFAWLSYTDRGDTTIQSGDDELTFDQASASQFLAVPVWIGRQDMVVVGDYIATTRFEPVNREGSGTDVYSTGFGGAWLRQASPDWQYGAFAAPFGSSGLNDESSWSWQAFAGAGALYYGQTDFLWIFAGVVDYSEEESFVFPYAGFSWTISSEWALNMILPWPSISYGPTPNVVISAGAVPSLSSWRLDDSGQDLSVSLGGWDVGAGVEYRVCGIGWVYTRAGMSGFRGFQMNTDGEVDGIEAEPDAQPFVTAGIDFRM